jgi:hypothetical protein
MTLRDVEVIELLADTPELLAIADAVSATQQKWAKPSRRRIAWWVSDVPALLPPSSRQVAQPRRLVGLSAAVAAVVAAGVVVGLLVTAASPPSAYAAAKKAMAATAAAASGTMTLSSGTSSSIAAGMSTVVTVRWNGKDVAIASGSGGSVLPGFDRLLLVGGGAYLQRADDGSWLHYASEADLEPSLGSGTVLAAYGLAVASRAAQIIASAYGLQKTEQPDGSTVYSGTIPPNSPAKGAPSKDLGGLVMDSAQSMLPTFGSGGAFQLVVGSDGLVRQMSETAAPPATGAWRVEYSRLGDPQQITPPAAYSEGTAADLPTPPQETKAPRKTAPHPAATVPAGTVP